MKRKWDRWCLGICFKTVWEEAAGGVKMKPYWVVAGNYWSWVMTEHGLIIIQPLLYMLDVYNKMWKKKFREMWLCLHSGHASPSHRRMWGAAWPCTGKTCYCHNYKTSLGVSSSSLSPWVSLSTGQSSWAPSAHSREEFSAVTKHARF